MFESPKQAEEIPPSLQIDPWGDGSDGRILRRGPT
jgi:hypothetical protein